MREKEGGRGCGIGRDKKERDDHDDHDDEDIDG